MSEKVIVDMEDLTLMANTYRASTGSTETFNVSQLSTTMSNVVNSDNAIYSVAYIEQDLTDTQKEQARNNIEVEKKDPSYRISNYSEDLGQAFIAKHNIIDVIGIPTYYDTDDLAVAPCSDFGLTYAGWYTFLSFLPPNEVSTVTVSIDDGEATTLTADDSGRYSIAVNFYTTHLFIKVTFNWDDMEEIWYVRAQDLVTLTLDYRATAYVFDLSPYVTYTYKTTTTGTLFTDDRHYYTLIDGEYVEAEVVVGEKVSGTYYEHSKTRIEGFALNTIYQLSDIDSQSVLVLPDPPDEGYGGWFKIHTNFLGSYSITIENADSFIWANKNFAPTAGTQIICGEWHSVSKKWRLSFTSFEPPEEE